MLIVNFIIKVLDFVQSGGMDLPTHAEQGSGRFPSHWD